jgi:hypothetical protein
MMNRELNLGFRNEFDEQIDVAHANACLAATAICLALALWTLQATPFLIPYRDVLIARYGVVIAVWASLFYVNVFAACYLIGRTLFLKDTGDKLAHLEKQLRSRVTISSDLSARLED